MRGVVDGGGLSGMITWPRLGLSWPLSLKYCPRAVLSPAGLASRLALLVSQMRPRSSARILLKLNPFFFFPFLSNGFLTLCFVPLVSYQRTKRADVINNNLAIFNHRRSLYCKVCILM